MKQAEKKRIVDFSLSTSPFLVLDKKKKSIRIKADRETVAKHKKRNGQVIFLQFVLCKMFLKMINSYLILSYSLTLCMSHRVKLYVSAGFPYSVLLL